MYIAVRRVNCLKMSARKLLQNDVLLSNYHCNSTQSRIGAVSTKVIDTAGFSWYLVHVTPNLIVGFSHQREWIIYGKIDDGWYCHLLSRTCYNRCVISFIMAVRRATNLCNIRTFLKSNKGGPWKLHSTNVVKLVLKSNQNESAIQLDKLFRFQTT